MNEIVNKSSIRFNSAVLAVCFVLYCISKLEPVISFNCLIAWHFADLLAIPSLLAVYNLIQGVLSRPMITGFIKISLVALIGSVFWELIYPLYNTTSTSDLIDAVVYYIGAILYYSLHRFLTVKHSQHTQTCVND